MAKALGDGDRAQFLGARNDLPRFYRAADAFVLPSAYEAFALVSIEAMACGLPIFVTRIGGTEEYIQDWVNGRFISRVAEDLGDLCAEVFGRAVIWLIRCLHSGGGGRHGAAADH